MIVCNFTLGTTVFLALSASAFAADLPSSSGPAVYVPPPILAFSWSGFYVGGQVGYEFGQQTFSSTVNGVVLSGRSSGVLGGGHVGYNYVLPDSAFGGLVLGIEGDVDGGDDKSNVVGLNGATVTTKSDIKGSVRGRVGFAVDRTLFYATGGVAFSKFDSVLSTASSLSFSSTRTGWTIGGGAEYAITPNWSLRAEYRYSDYGTYSPFSSAGVTFVRAHAKDSTVTAGFSYLFATAITPVVARY